MRLGLRGWQVMTLSLWRHAFRKGQFDFTGAHHGITQRRVGENNELLGPTTYIGASHTPLSRKDALGFAGSAEIRCSSNIWIRELRSRSFNALGSYKIV